MLILEAHKQNESFSKTVAHKVCVFNHTIGTDGQLNLTEKKLSYLVVIHVGFITADVYLPFID